MFLSILVPCYKEELNVQRLNYEINQEMNKINQDYELVLVNDGSPDNTLKVIKDEAKHDEHIKYISFSRNFGKESAIIAGLEHCTGDCIVIMDADLQHPPSYIKNLIEEYNKGYDQVVMKRDRDGEKLLRRIPTQIYYKTMNKVMDVKLSDGEGDFRLISRDVAEAIIHLKEHNRFSKGIFEWVGFKKKTIPFKNVIREEGQSSFNMMRLIDYAIDGILNYNNKPLRICFYLGGITMSLSILYILIMLIQIITSGITEPGYFTIIASILFLGSLQLFSLGIVGEYIGRIYSEVKGRPHYIIEDTNIDNPHKFSRYSENLIKYNGKDEDLV